MFNARKFRAQVILRGLTMRQVAEALDIDTTTLYRKMSGESDFYRREIQVLCDILDIEDPAAIFFADKLT